MRERGKRMAEYVVPVDDIATAEDLEAHKIAMEEYAKGETVPHEAINWN